MRNLIIPGAGIFKLFIAAGHSGNFCECLAIFANI